MDYKGEIVPYLKAPENCSAEELKAFHALALESGEVSPVDLDVKLATHGDPIMTLSDRDVTEGRMGGDLFDSMMMLVQTTVEQDQKAFHSPA